MPPLRALSGPQAKRSRSRSAAAQGRPVPGRSCAPPPQGTSGGLAWGGLAGSARAAPYRLLCRLDMVLTSGSPTASVASAAAPQGRGKLSTGLRPETQLPACAFRPVPPAHVPPPFPVAGRVGGGRGAKATPPPRLSPPPPPAGPVTELRNALTAVQMEWERWLFPALCWASLSLYLSPCPLPCTFLTRNKLWHHGFRNVLSLLNYTGFFTAKSSTPGAVIAGKVVQ